MWRATLFSRAALGLLLAPTIEANTESLCSLLPAGTTSLGGDSSFVASCTDTWTSFSYGIQMTFEYDWTIAKLGPISFGIMRKCICTEEGWNAIPDATFTFGKSNSFPIPGMSLNTGLGTLGLQVEAELTGTISDATLKISVGFCNGCNCN